VSVDGLRLEPGFAAVPAEPSRRTLDIRFTGSGSEYFRIWAVNLLLILITLGLYLPFAKARRIRYFYANTLVDGQALSFHGDPWKMFRGFVLLVVLTGAYVGLSSFSAVLGGLAFLALMLMWPPLWRAGMRFRLTHTSWRGLRFGFAGDVAGAYGAFLPIGIPLALLVAVPEDAGPVFRVLAGLGALAFNFMLPWTLGLAKRYQHNHYRFAHLQTRTWLEPYQVFGLSFRAGFIGTVVVILAGIVAAIIFPLLRQGVGSIPGYMGFGLVFALAYVWVSCAFTAGLQNLAWSKTASEGVLFKSDLQALALARLTVKNWLLMIITLGLYRPFAAVATTRLKLEAVTLETSVDLDTLAGDAAATDANAAGDFAGDFFGIDMGL
jgi:uncharacterized membrane protein YjgN (DUF898 family)